LRDADFAGHLLAWYDDNARVLGWRVGPAARRAGVRPDPYRVWLSEVMLQQTTVAAVNGYFRLFVQQWPDVHALAGASDDRVMAAWAGLGYYARARNLLKCARLVSGQMAGRFPDTAPALQALPGIGPYTAAAIAAIAFDRPETVVDGNVERVVARLFALRAPLPGVKPAMHAAAARLAPDRRPGDFAQAMMDLGATVCTPRGPACGVCPLAAGCRARQLGLATDLPARGPKAERPLRRGTAFVARDPAGAWLVERRPPKGLLGGMLGWPGSDWGDQPAFCPPFAADWQDCGAEVRHTFTHFHLRLQVYCTRAPAGTLPARGHWIAADRFRPGDLPTVMRKVHDLAAPRLVPH